MLPFTESALRHRVSASKNPSFDDSSQEREKGLKTTLTMSLSDLLMDSSPAVHPDLGKSGAGGMRQLPVLPPWCAARELQGLPGVEELESMPDARALEVILGTILSTASDGDHRLAGRVERGVRRSAGVGIR